MKRFCWFVFGGILAIIFYLIGIGIYTRIAKDPIIFFASLVIAIAVAFIICLVGKKVTKELFDKFTMFVIGIVYCLGIVLLAVFGPTFIDRSISYHIVFYAVEEEQIYKENMEKITGGAVFDKRIHDALETGFLVQNQDGSMVPTLKAKAMYYIMKPIGELTGSLETYYDIKEEVENAKDAETTTPNEGS